MALIAAPVLKSFNEWGNGSISDHPFHYQLDVKKTYQGNSFNFDDLLVIQQSSCLEI
jgi:hypothetical protein